MQDKYRLKFPELESLVHHPIDYARVVKAIGNEMDITLVDLEDILPQVGFDLHKQGERGEKGVQTVT